MTLLSACKLFSRNQPWQSSLISLSFTVPLFNHATGTSVRLLMQLTLCTSWLNVPVAKRCNGLGASDVVSVGNFLFEAYLWCIQSIWNLAHYHRRPPGNSQSGEVCNTEHPHSKPLAMFPWFLNCRKTLFKLHESQWWRTHHIHHTHTTHTHWDISSPNAMEHVSLMQSCWGRESEGDQRNSLWIRGWHSQSESSSKIQP